MSLLATSTTVRRLAATTALAALAALAFGFCVCEMPMPSEAGACHATAAEAPPQPSPDGTWSRGCCCSGDPQLPPGTLEARAPDAKRGAGLLAAASASVAWTPAFGEEASRSQAPAWLLAASPPHAPPPAFVLPLRV